MGADGKDTAAERRTRRGLRGSRGGNQRGKEERNRLSASAIVSMQIGADQDSASIATGKFNLHRLNRERESRAGRKT